MYSNYLKERVTKFLKKYSADIVEALTDTGLYFPGVVAQKCLESNYGDSKLAAEHNNFGGIKNFGSLPNATVVYMDTTEFKNGVRVASKEPFAKYESPKIFFQEYVRVLRDPSKKYISMGVFDADSPEDMILRLARAGYTTTPPSEYLKSMQGIIDCVRDLTGFGKIESNPAADAERHRIAQIEATNKANQYIIGETLGSMIKPVTSISITK